MHPAMAISGTCELWYMQKNQKQQKNSTQSFLYDLDALYFVLGNFGLLICADILQRFHFFKLFILIITG